MFYKQITQTVISQYDMSLEATHIIILQLLTCYQAG